MRGRDGGSKFKGEKEQGLLRWVIPGVPALLYEPPDAH